ncbi:MAG TPA: 2,4-dihydroxyhept-2-ene-1,7-dioic acid aldolase [Candidatus Atribacteria bacterium]|nr:2,4-dihydroxyhept-2-ene-1,7-dioic acid aldolase [Candidatus Atribacteria bacterium]
MRKNKLREILTEGKPTLATRLLSVCPGLVEIIGHTGMFDYVEFLGEYSPWDLHDLENISRAVELFDMSSMIKVDQNCRAFIAQRALGSGIQNILFTDIRTVEEAKECVGIVRAETPEAKGINGAANRRNVGYYLEAGSLEYVKAMDEAVVALMIEKKEAIDNLEEILSVKGIDMVQFGPGDYSLSLGYPGQRNHPKVKEAELKTIKTALGKGIRPRVEIGSIDYKLENLQKYIELGVRDFSLPSEGKIVYEWLKKHGKNIRKSLF